jgi:hypothetical protein
VRVLRSKLVERSEVLTLPEETIQAKRELI